MERQLAVKEAPKLTVREIQAAIVELPLNERLIIATRLVAELERVNLVDLLYAEIDGAYLMD